MERQSISDWVEQRKLRGYYSFTYEDVKEAFRYIGDSYLSTALTRLVRSKKIISPAKGFYVIIPTEYGLTGLVPATFYIGRMMEYLNRHYYVGLLNAAAFYGAAHQRPQSFSIMNDGVPIRDGVRAGIRFAFVRKKAIPEKYLDTHQGKLGGIKVSSPELTALDIIEYQCKIGGLNRACSVLNELSESLNFSRLDDDYFTLYGVPVYQRLGYILECILEETSVAEQLYKQMKNIGLPTHFRRVPFKVGKPAEDCEINHRWKIIINQEIDIDE